MKTTWRNLIKEDSGSIAVVAALALTMLFGFAALALDIGHLLSMENELKRTADAGALAGARALWPATLPVIAATTPNCANAQTTALSVATNSYNKVDGAGLPSVQVTVQTGRWNFPSSTFTPGSGSNTNAVQVITRATGSMFFAEVFGISSQTLSATSIAVMDFAQSSGDTDIPIAINQANVIAGQTLSIDFADNGGWFSIAPDSASASTFNNYINNDSIPTLNMGEIINLQNGVDASVLKNIQTHLESYGGTWDTFLPVVNTDKFNQSQSITGFVPFHVTSVTTTGSHKVVSGIVLGLDESANAQPGGTNLGLLAPVKLVF